MQNIVGASLSKQLLRLHAHEQTKLHLLRLPTILSTCGLSIFRKYGLKIYGICPQAHTYVRTYVCIHTHLRNAVPLMWGSLRLAPMKLCYGMSHRRPAFFSSLTVRSTTDTSATGTRNAIPVSLLKQRERICQSGKH